MITKNYYLPKQIRETIITKAINITEITKDVSFIKKKKKKKKKKTQFKKKKKKKKKFKKIF